MASDQDPSAWALEQAEAILTEQRLSVRQNRAWLARALDAADGPWKQAVIDAAVVHWTLAEGQETNPRAAIAALLAETHRQALDPAISEDMQKALDAARAEEREACAKVVKPALLLAQRWLANSIAVSEIPGKEPLPAIAKALAALRTRGEEPR